MKIAAAIGILILVFMVSGCQKDQEKAAETKQVDPEIKCAIIEISPFSYVCLPYQGDFWDHRSAVEAFREAASMQGFELADTMLAIHHHLPGQGSDTTVWDIGFVVPESLVVMQPLSVKKWNFSAVVQATYLGPEHGMDAIYPQVFKFMKSHHLTPAGPSIVRFPANHLSNDPAASLAEILFAIKND